MPSEKRPDVPKPPSAEKPDPSGKQPKRTPGGTVVETIDATRADVKKSASSGGGGGTEETIDAPSEQQGAVTPFLRSTNDTDDDQITVFHPMPFNPAPSGESKTVDFCSDQSKMMDAPDGGTPSTWLPNDGQAQTVELATYDAESYRSTIREQRTYKKLGRFEIIKILGSGAFGTVFFAHDPQLDRRIALKVAKTGVLVRESDRTRFLREARAAAQLRHPNIVPVYEFGQIEEVSYIAYQFIDGKSFKQVLRSAGKLPVPETVEIMVKLAAALDYAHEQGIIHRDMKPDNVMIDGKGEPHITDFGCARREEGSIHRTMEGSIMGTPAYMSPEQATGRSNEADGRSDVWSLGVMIEEALTGVLPFQGTLTEVLISIREREAFPIRQLDKSLPKDLETICQKCLAKKPEERFAKAGDLADELGRFQRGEPIISRRISPVARAWRWAKRNPVVASLELAIFLIVTVLGSTAAAGWYQSIRSNHARALSQVASLRTAESASVPVLLDSIRPFRSGVLPQIQEQATQLTELVKHHDEARLNEPLERLRADFIRERGAATWVTSATEQLARLRIALLSLENDARRMKRS